jgi:hydroxypyruvate isomerase
LRSKTVPKLCANLTLLFNEASFPERFKASAQAGFTGVEYLFPYPNPQAQLAELPRASGLAQILHHPPAGDWDNGERGFGEYKPKTTTREGLGWSTPYLAAR